MYAHEVAASPPSRPRSRRGNNVSGLRCRRTVSGGGHVRPGGGILGRRVTGSDGRVPTYPAARANAGAVSAQPVAGPVVLLPARRRSRHRPRHDPRHQAGAHPADQPPQFRARVAGPRPEHRLPRPAPADRLDHHRAQHTLDRAGTAAAGVVQRDDRLARARLHAVARAAQQVQPGAAAVPADPRRTRIRAGRHRFPGPQGRVRRGPRQRAGGPRRDAGRAGLRAAGCGLRCGAVRRLPHRAGGLLRRRYRHRMGRTDPAGVRARADRRAGRILRGRRAGRLLGPVRHHGRHPRLRAVPGRRARTRPRVPRCTRCSTTPAT